MSDVGPTCLDDLNKGKMVEGDSGSDPTVAPEWLDIDRYNKTMKWMTRHAMTCGIFWHCSLVFGMCLESLLEALVFTGASSTPSTSKQRYMDTAARLMEWHVGNIWDSKSTAGKSIASVRAMHAGVRAAMEKPGSGVTPPEGFCGFLTQYDVATVQTGFMGGLSIVPTKFGLRCPEEQIADYVYFWKCCGYQLGVADTFNVCGRGKEVSDALVWEIIDKVLLPMTKHPDSHYSQMAQAYCDGMNIGMPFKLITVESTNACTYWALNNPDYPVPKLSLGDTLRFYCMYRVLFLLIGYCPFFEWVGSWLMCQGYKNQPPSQRTGVCPFTGATYSDGSCPVDAEGARRCPHAPPPRAPLAARAARRALAWYILLGVLAFWAAAAAAACGVAYLGAALLPGGGPWAR